MPNLRSEENRSFAATRKMCLDSSNQEIAHRLSSMSGTNLWTRQSKGALI